MNKIILLLILATSLFSCSKNEKTNYDLVIQNVGLFDGLNDKGVINIGINADTIALITKKSIAGDLVIDGTDKYLLPGLINSHVHITSPKDLEESLNAGIMAVIDLHQSSEDRAATLRSYRDSTGYAYFLSSGFAATLPGGHPTQYGAIETISDSLSAEQWVQNRLNNGADYIKIIRDGAPGPPDFQPIPTLNFEQIEDIIVSAKKHNQLTIAHTASLEETMKIAQLGIDGFAHLWMGIDSATAEQLAFLSDHNIFVIPTAQTQLQIWETKIEGGPLHIKEYAEQNMASMKRVQREIARLNEAGVTILAGNDPPNFDIVYGKDLFIELDIYSKGGLSNIEILKTVTSNPSKVFGLDEIGIIREGMSVNMLLVEGNPIEDLKYLTNIKHIWKNGELVK